MRIAPTSLLAVELLLGLLLAAGCRSQPIEPVLDGGPKPDLTDLAVSCPPRPDLLCVKREDGPCSALVRVDPVCGADGQLVCPDGAGPLVESPARITSCLPFQTGPNGRIARIAGLGIPIDSGEGRCAWLLSNVVADGSTLESLGVYIPPDLPVGACPTEPDPLGGFAPYEPVGRAGFPDDDVFSLRSSVTVSGETRVFFRHYAPDPDVTFGLRNLGSGVATWNVHDQRLDLDDSLVWPNDGQHFDFGDAAVLDAQTPTVIGCGGAPMFLSYNCQLARALFGPVESPDSYEYWTGQRWSRRIDDATTVFQSGPEQSAVRYHTPTNRYLHLFIVGFGSDVQLQVATQIEGPWTRAVTLLTCDLPASDKQAFCRSPVLHPELYDPLRPNEIVLHYDIGTLAPDGDRRRSANPAAYWPRLVRVSLP